MSTFGHSARRIVPLAWPMFVGQFSVLAFGTIDTVLLGRAPATELAALAVGSAIYMTVFIGLMGVLMALSPIVGQLHGAGRDAEAGRQAHQALWLALALALLGSTLLSFPAPFMALAQADAEVAPRLRAFLQMLAVSLPAALLFAVWRAFNLAVSRPKAVMLLQVGGLALKLPLSFMLAFGVPAIGLPALGVVGCGIATALAMWLQVLLAAAVLRRDPFYTRFELLGHGLQRPDRQAIGQQLRLGVPMGAGIAVEVTGFTFMAIFIARLGTTPVAGHQIAVNVVSMLFMVPLAIGMATSTLVAQAVGAGAPREARLLSWHGMALGIALAVACGAAVYVARGPMLRLYTANTAVLAVALPLLTWVALFHVADAAQTLAACILRAYKITVVPVLIYVAALWVVGLGGGYTLAFDAFGHVPPALQGARGFWTASTTGLVLAGTALTVYLRRVLKASVRESGRQRGKDSGKNNGKDSTKQLPPPLRASQRTLPP